MYNRYAKLLADCKNNKSKKIASEYVCNLKKDTTLPFLTNELNSDKQYKELLEKIGLSKKTFVDLANKFSYTDYDKEKRKILSPLYKTLVDTLKQTTKAENILVEIKNFFGYVDDIYSQQKYRKFLYHIRKGTFDFKNLPDLTKEYPINVFFDKIEDCFLGFVNSDNEFVNVYVRVSKLEYNMFNKEIGENKNTLVFSIFRAIDDVKNILLAEFSVFENDKENIYIKPNKEICSAECPFKNEKLFYAYEEKDGTKTSFCEKNSQDVKMDKCAFSFFEPIKLISLCAYVCDMYNNRRVINRKNSKAEELFTKNPVSIQTVKKSNDNYIEETFATDYKIVKLNEYYKYERDRKEWQGGHHSSPVEHERSEHTRVYRNKDGSVKKIIKVRGSVINRGGKRAVYKIN